MKAGATSRIRVLQVIASLDPAAGGPPVSAIATAVALRKRGVMNGLAYVDRVGVAASREAETLSQAGVAAHRFPVVRTGGALGVRWGISFRLAFWLLRHAHRFDVLHAHGAWTFTTAGTLAAARLRRRVAVLSSHESLTDFDQTKSPPFRRSLKKALRWFYVRSFNAVVVASAVEQRDLGARAAPRSTVIPHAISGELAVGQAEANRDGSLRVGFLGRLDPKKNLDTLIDAVASLPADVSLDVAGDGSASYRAFLVSRARERGLDGRIRWLGFVEGAEKRQFLSAIDVLVMPSAFEGFGLAAAEAIVAGVPVIVSPRTGIASLVERHGCGAIVQPQAADIRRELERVAFLRGDARRATANAGLELSLDEHGAALVDLYDQLISRRPGGRRA